MQQSAYKEQKVYWDTLTFGDWTFYLAATDVGLCHLVLPQGTIETLHARVGKSIPGAQLVASAEALAPYASQIREYLQGERRVFTLPLDLHGTPFQMEVWNALCRIPYGETRSYAEIAHEIARTQAVRAVGAANGANPVALVVPCHRVIGKNGSLTGYAGGLALKAALLQLEARTLHSN
jgi:methylated-DNA-[protein]-cysteine S-methyltransferase